MIQVKKTAGLWAPSEAFLPATVGLVLASTALFIPTMAITTNRSLSVRPFLTTRQIAFLVNATGLFLLLKKHVKLTR